MTLAAFVSKGKDVGKPLHPHKHKDGMYVASHSKFAGDYLRVDTVEQLQALVEAGYGARMSNRKMGIPASYIVSKNITITKKNTVYEELKKTFSAVELDPESMSKRRAEQIFLRAHLLKGLRNGECAICGSVFPENLLVAAHIKERSSCTNEEKLDFEAIASLMCKMGCDALFEHGYIYVNNGIISKNSIPINTLHLNKVLEKLDGKAVANWYKSEKYYTWHKEKWMKIKNSTIKQFGK